MQFKSKRDVARQMSEAMTLTGPFILERQGCPLAYWRAGPEDAPAVVFCHGARMDHRIFDDQLACLVPGYQVLLIDLRGHGQSRPMGEAFSIDVAAEDVMALMDRCLMGKAVLLGHSMGGLIVQTIAKHHPERVRGLVLIGTTRLTAKLPPFSGILQKAFNKIVDISPDSWTKWLLGRGAGTQERTKRTAARASQMIPKEDFQIIWAGILQGLRPEPAYQLPVPVLLVQSDKDWVGLGLLRFLSHGWAKHEAQCHYVIIPNARHNMMQDSPEVFNRHLLKFLNALSAPD
ncbi:MAG: alpha/beta hydrolase [Desulfobacteraceae bacterium]|nr:MAG: alpha/beta hydrolase [Desulfobacteraceae bacterium]